MPKIVLGLSWFKREDYERVLAIMEDSHVLPADFDEWEKRAKAQEASGKAKGVTVRRVIVDPEKFIAWCASKRIALNAQARGKFAAEGAMRMEDN